MVFDLLSEPIRHFIRDKRWEQFRPIQAAAIERILASKDNFILASRTASGKTEAAFLPILSKIDFHEQGVQVLYISPLIALINDQFYRVEELCKYLDVPVTKWHGEANRTEKNRLLKEPRGIVLITPESLEAMFVNKPYNVRHLFSNLKYVVIDEIHSFIGTDRGIQLKSILSRLQMMTTERFSIVGLSATIGDYDEAKKFTGDAEHTRVLLDRTAKEIHAEFRFFEAKTQELPLELLKDLYLETKDNKALIFPNSRGKAEEVAVKLLKISEKVKGHSNYFSHHSSVDKEVREYVEQFAKNSAQQNFCIACTSTLELGIDIGTVDEVVQIDATNSIASLIQRVGRSGRREGERSNLFLYATDRWNLLQALACWILFTEGFIEPPDKNEKPYGILLHQALSITKGHSGIQYKQLVNELKNNFAFREITREEIEFILNHLVETGLLEKLRDEVIIGVDGEKIVNSRDFYSVFISEPNFKVINAGNTIGEIPFSPQIREDENILLAARIWKIKYVDMDAKRIEVIRALDGKKPKFFGGGTSVHPRVREKMMEILFSKQEYPLLDEAARKELAEMRKEFSIFPIEDTSNSRPLLAKDQSVVLYSFTGTRVNRTLSLIFDAAEIGHTLNDDSSSFEIRMPLDDFMNKWNKLKGLNIDFDFLLRNFLEKNPAVMDSSKWGRFLPEEFMVSLLKNKQYDIFSITQILNMQLV